MKKPVTIPKPGVLCLFVLLFIFNPFSAKANHDIVFAEEISYSHIRGDSVLVTINVYGGCVGFGIENYSWDLQVIPENSSPFKVTTKSVSSTAITSFVKKGQCTKCTDQTCALGFGIKKFVFEAIVDLKNYTDCKFTFAYTGFKRYVDGNDIYVEATLNRCIDGYVNSPKFSYDPIYYLCKDECMQKMHSAIGNTGDSLVYSLAHPKISSFGYYNYYPATYSYTKPLTFSTSGSGCNGFTLNKNTGQLIFKPTLSGDYSPVVIQVDQYHPDSTGKMVKTGTTIRDLTFMVMDCPKNNAPTLTSGTADQTDFFVCADNEVNIKFYTGDADQSDTVNIAYMLSMENASFTSTTNKLWNTGTFNWTPQESDIQKAPHQIMLSAYDSKSPIVGKTEKVYRVFVVAKRPELIITQKNKGCGLVNLSVSGADTSTIKNYAWQINGQIIKAKNADLQATKNGNYIVKLIAMNKAGCESIYTDTVKITELPEIDLGKDTTLCAGTELQINVAANMAYTYKWQPNPTLSSDTIASPKIKPATNQVFVVEVTDTKGCKSIDSLKVDVQPLKFTISKDTNICRNKAITLQVGGLKNTVYKWSPSNGISNPNDSVITVYPQQTTTYIVTATNASGCSSKDSVKVTIGSSKAFAGDDVSICHGDSTLVRGSGGYSYSWVNKQGLVVSKLQQTYLKPDATEEFYLYAQDSLGCQVTMDKITVNVLNIPVQITPDTTMCDGDTTQLHVAGGHIYNWLPENTLSGNASSSPIIFPRSKTTYFVQIQDTLQHCSVTKSVTVTINKDCVWPGDANKDGIVNYKDVLFIGVAYASTGPKRNNATTNWKVQNAENWSGSTSNSINYKHMDADGNGEVMGNDKDVVKTNYSKTYNYTNIPYTEPQNGAPLYIDMGKDTFYAADTVMAKIYLGDANMQFNKLYGAGVEYVFKSNAVIDGSQQVLTENTFFTPVASEKLTLINLDNNGGEFSISRTNKNDVTGYGEIAEIKLILKDTTYNYASTGEKITIKPVDALVIDRTGKSQDVIISGDSAIVLRKKKESHHIGIKEQSIFSQLHIYPNPANNLITIQSAKNITGDIYITNALGQVVEKANMQNQQTKIIDVKHFSAGIYMVQLISGNNISTQKLIIYK